MLRVVIVVVTSALAAVPAFSAGPPGPWANVADPTYAAWRRFPMGTAVAVESVGEQSGTYKSRKKWRIVTTTTLLSVSDESVKLRHEVTEEIDDAKAVTLPPQSVTHARLVEPTPAPKPAGVVVEGEREVEFAGKPFKAKYLKVEETNFNAEGSVHILQTWTSREVPGGLVRHEDYMDGTDWYKDRVTVTVLSKPAR